MARHDGGHEEAAGDSQAAVEGHEDEVGGAQDDERVQREVAILALAYLVLRGHSSRTSLAAGL